MTQGVVKLRLTVDVVYDTNGTDPQDLKHNLEWLVHKGASEGVFTNNTDAEVVIWSGEVEEIK